MTRSPSGATAAALAQRAAMMAAVRHFFSEQGFLEVDTPIRIPAPAPEAHIDPEPAGEYFLQTSPELCMKRLLAAGFPKIFQICKCFRRNERGRRHLPEMTLLEWYMAGMDYRGMMDQTEALIRHVMDRLGVGSTMVYQETSVDVTPGWERLTVAEAFERYGGMSLDRALVEDHFDEIMGLEIEPQLGCQRPVFLKDYPLAHGALARPQADDPTMVERFELYIAGVELCNGFSELTDADEQRRRFEQVCHDRSAQGEPASPMPETFLNELPQMPEAAGNALGLDRLAMVLNGTDSIDAVVAFTPETL